MMSNLLCKRLHLNYYFRFQLWPNRLRSVHPYVRPSTESFSDFDLIWCVGRSRPDMRTSVTLTQSKVKIKVTELLKFQKLHFSMSISSAILAWRSKLMVDYDSVRPSLQHFGARFFNFLLSKLTWLQTSTECRHYRTFKGPYFCTAWGYTTYSHMVW